MDETKTARRQERIVAVVIIAFAAAAFLLSLPMPGNAPIFPRIASTLLGILGAALLIQSFRREKEGKEPEVPALKAGEMASPGMILLISVLYALGFRYIGFYVSTAVVVIVEMYYMGIRSVKSFILVDGILLVFLYWLFTMQLGVLMPRGILF